MAYVIQPAQAGSHLGPDRPAGRGARLRAGLAAWLSTTVDRLSRREQIEALMALSDADLAARGLTRDGIVPHVFRDRMGL